VVLEHTERKLWYVIYLISCMELGNVVSKGYPLKILFRVTRFALHVNDIKHFKRSNKKCLGCHRVYRHSDLV